jgi:REP-associated tyrosine transposase
VRPRCNILRLSTRMDKFLNKYRISSIRLQTWDYASQGLYFITICTKNRENYFGRIMVTDAQNVACLQSTPIGAIAHKNWMEIPLHFPFVELDEFVLMPDHVHGIVFVNPPYLCEWTTNKFGPQSKNLASIIRGYKASVKTFSTINQIEFEWQSRFHDRIIHSAKELSNVRQNIINNPANWHRDKDNLNSS